VACSNGLNSHVTMSTRGRDVAAAAKRFRAIRRAAMTSDDSARLISKLRKQMAGSPVTHL
jgi:hypothetical protein